jgi:hypothetical protein
VRGLQHVGDLPAQPAAFGEVVAPPLEPRGERLASITKYARRSGVTPKSNTWTMPGLRIAVAARASLKNRWTMSASLDSSRCNTFMTTRRPSAS